MSAVDFILTRPGDGIRARRMRRWARRELDELLGESRSNVECTLHPAAMHSTLRIDPWEHAEPLDWHESHMDRGVRERDAIGERMATAGWLP